MSSKTASAAPLQSQTSGRSASTSLAGLAANRWLPPLLVLLAGALLLLAADALLLRLHPGSYRVPIGNYRDEFFLRETNDQEVSADGQAYRWTTARSTLVLGQVGVAPDTVLTLELGGRPARTAAQLTLAGQPWLTLPVAETPRNYRLLLPPTPGDTLMIGIASPTFSVPGDTRQLGLKVEAFRIDLPPGVTPLPTPLHYLAQLGLLLAIQLCGLRLGLGWRGQALLALGVALALAALLSWGLLLAYTYLPTLAISAALLAGLTWLLLPHAERWEWLGDRREVRLLWLIMLIACAIRLLGLLYPTFDGQDLGRNVRRQIMSLVGQMYIISGSAEFAKGQTIYPTGPYLFLMPGGLFTTDFGNLIESLLTILEGTTVFLVAMLARRLGGSRDTARFAALLYLGSYASFSAHVYQFSAQIFGQWFTTPIALLLLARARPTLRDWGLAIIVLMFGVYSHIGVAILGISWFGLMLLLALRQPTRTIWLAIGLFAAAVAGAALLMYLDIVAITLSHAGNVVADRAEAPRLTGLRETMLRGARLAYSDIGLLLLPPGLWLLARAQPDWQRLLVPLSLLLTALFYLLVNIVLGLQVRYFYFALPLVLVAIGFAASWLAARGRLGRLAAYALVLAISLPGVWLWFSTTLGEGQISMTPLTH